MPELSSATTAPVPTGAVGVLFDLDDTLVDLRSAMRGALLDAAAAELVGLDDSQRAGFSEHFSRDEAGYYDRYVAGELGFGEQRLLRLQAALRPLGRTSEQGQDAFSAAFEDSVRRRWVAFDDVMPTLAQLDDWGVPYGVVTNNVEAYQRSKLDRIGLGHIGVVVGSDTAGAPKPDSRSYLAGVAKLGTPAAGTLMVGDNPGHDVAGAEAAGLPALLLDRFDRFPELGGARDLSAVLDWVGRRLGLRGSARFGEAGEIR